MPSNVLGLLRQCLELLAPAHCPLCERPDCDACLARLTPPPRESLDGIPLVCAFAYEDVRAPIARFKYGGHWQLAPALSGQLVGLMRSQLGPAVTCVPVPLDASRLAERGFNQAALVAQQLARGLGVRCAERALRRAPSDTHQAGATAATRRALDEGLFAVSRGAPSGPVILVDDVVTTGTTARRCMQVFASAGIQVAAVAALARA